MPVLWSGQLSLEYCGIGRACVKLKGVTKLHKTVLRLPGVSVLAYITILVKTSGWSLLEFLVFTLNFNLACGLECLVNDLYAIVCLVNNIAPGTKKHNGHY